MYAMIILILGGILGLYMAWNIGANDFANSMASAVGAKAITYRQVLILGAVMEFTGAFFVGSHVSETVRKGIFDPTLMSDHAVALGALAALGGAALWVTLSTWKELPVSTTHSIVGGLWGFAIVMWFRTGVDPINWVTLVKVTLSWILSPIAGAIVAFVVFWGITRVIFNSEEPIKRTRLFGPILIGLTGFIISASLLMKTNLGKMLLGSKDAIIPAIIISSVMFVISAILGYFIIRHKLGRHEMETYIEEIEEMFRKLQIGTSAYVAFAHGANDVANAVGPMATVIYYAMYGTVGTTVPIPWWVLALGGTGIVLGIATWGKKVIETVGTKITHLTNTRGFSVDFATATTVLVASKLGMPISTTHVVVGAVIGVGLARGLEAVDLGIVKKIVWSWIFTLPVAAVTTAGIYIVLDYLL